MLRRCLAGALFTVAFATGGLLPACYPTFEFGSGGGDSASSTGRSAARSGSGGDDAATSSTTGQGGMATTAASGGEGGALGTSASTGAVMPGPTVACGPGTPEACATGEICCYNETSASLDACSAGPGCGSGFYVLACNGPSDCDAGKICCAAYYEFLFTPFFDGAIRCEDACTYPSVPMCEAAEDCSPGETCAPLADLDETYAADYRACQ